VEETQLGYNSMTRRLTLSGGGVNRATVKASGHARIIADIVAESPGKTVNGLKALARDTAIGNKVQDAQDAIKEAVRTGLVHAHPGPNAAQHHHPGARCSECGTHRGSAVDPVDPSRPPVDPGSPVVGGPLPYRGSTTTTTAGQTVSQGSTQHTDQTSRGGRGATDAELVALGLIPPTTRQGASA